MVYDQFDPYNGLNAAYGAVSSLSENAELPQGLWQGDAGAVVKPPFMGRKRMKLNIVAIFVCLFVPWLLFTLLFADVSFRLHFKNPALCWSLVAFAFLIVSCIGCSAGRNISHLYQGNLGHYQPTWLVFLFLTSLAAAVLGTVLGNVNFWQNMSPYYDLKNLNDYSYVDPSRMRGAQMMDAGRVGFLNDAMVDVSRAYAFQNQDTYCVAPITMYSPALGSATPLSSYDFWAVGLNCCGGNSSQTVDFRCGVRRDTADHTAVTHQGLRVMNAEQRPYFRLAVQQAEAAHMITSDHPLFFSWTEDASEATNALLEDAFKMFASWMCGLFVVQLSLVLSLSYILSKMGHSNL